MQRFKELPYLTQIGIVIGTMLLLTAGVYFAWLRPMELANAQDVLTLKARRAELAQLSPYRSKLGELNAQTAALAVQMEAQKHIVPEEKEVPTFITVLSNEATASGVEVRRYSPKETTTKEYYVEVPFDVDVDGPYYSVLNYFDRLQKLERIVNVSHLTMAAMKGGKSPVKRSYKWAPNETVMASATVTTFYSVSKNTPPPAPAKK
jgi:type IV pilus assembly protein PilO